MVGSFGNFGQTNVPAGLSNVIAVAGGFSHCLALKENGTVVAWGKYGDGLTTATVPSNLTNVIAIAGGDYHSVALKADGTVAVWGKSAYTNVPAGLADAVAISCGTTHTLALKADGTVAVWGDSTPAPSSATNLVAVTTMGWWNLALRADGTVLEWGLPVYPDVPKPANLTNVVAIVTGYGYAEVLKADGTLVGWGRALDATNIPPGLSNVVAIASGDNHRIGLAPVNLPPRFFTASLSGSVSGGVNQPLTMPLKLLGLFDPNGDILTLQITSLPTNGRLYHYSTNGIGVEINTPGTVVMDPSRRVVFVPESDAYGSPYASFSFVANDGALSSVPATWTVSILPSPVIQSAAFTNGPPVAFTLSFSGLSNVSYSIWYSATLDFWTRLRPATQVEVGHFSFTDSSIANVRARFYRIQSP
jgi:hypothetical protein